MTNIGWLEILIIIAVILVILVLPKKLPQLAASLGKSIRNFKKGLKEGKEKVDATAEEVKEAAGGDELKETVAEIREAADVKGVLPGKKAARKSEAKDTKTDKA